MRDWSLKADDPFVLTLAADARFCTPDYADDQSWEIQLAGGDPPALSLNTSFGRRARSMRLFPFFSLAGRHVTDPQRPDPGAPWRPRTTQTSRDRAAGVAGQRAWRYRPGREGRQHHAGPVPCRR